MKSLTRLLSVILLRGRRPQTDGRIALNGLDADVDVIRDSWGIPHIRARTLPDLMAAQGFVHAQDRLWQMEVMRRLTSGRLSEFAGSSTLTLDWYSRMIGMPDMKRRVYEALDEHERLLLASYASGVNACIEMMEGRFPIEFSTLGFSPEPWTAVDGISSLPYLSWSLMFSHYGEKLLAVSRGGTLSAKEWNDIFPSYPGAELPDDDWFRKAPTLKLGQIHPGALAFHAGLSGTRAPAQLERVLRSLAMGTGASNNWVVARGSDGLPVLANDPHLGASLPAVWYFCHLEVPGEMNTGGASLAGTPGIVIGRNEHAAWGFTNVMLDAADILTYRVDPADPLSYRVGDRTARMRVVPMVFGLPKGKSITLPLHVTETGPVVTTLEKGVNAAAVLKWYGTLPDGALTDRSFTGLFSFMKADSVERILDAARSWQYSAQNFVAGDDKGHIGWHASGAAPIRSGYSGRLPGDATAGADWTGFHPYESMPHLLDPADGWIATANYRPEKAPPGPVLSHTWYPPFRVTRISDALSVMNRPGVEEFRKLQMDVHSLQADRVLPKLETLLARDTALQGAGAREAASLLRSWDREVRADSAGAAVYEVFITELTRCLLARLLGADLPLFFNARTYGPENEILDRPGSPLWTAAPALVVEEALARTIEVCAARMGRDRSGWSWGRMHRHVFRHVGARGRISRWLLNPAPRPAHGDTNTVNVAAFSVAQDTYNVAAVPSLRMVVPLGDLDGMRIIGPLGQSGQPGHPHYDDMTDPWRNGELVPLPLTQEGVVKVAREHLVLTPRQAGAG